MAICYLGPHYYTGQVIKSQQKNLINTHTVKLKLVGFSTIIEDIYKLILISDSTLAWYYNFSLFSFMMFSFIVGLLKELNNQAFAGFVHQITWSHNLQSRKISLK
jgi:hypothetical protein